METTCVYRKQNKSEVNFRIIYKDGITGEKLKMAKEYWKWDKKTQTKFAVKSVEDIAKRYNLSLHELNLDIKQHTECSIDFGICNCGCENNRTVHTRTDLLRVVRSHSDKSICEACEIDRNEMREFMAMEREKEHKEMLHTNTRITAEARAWENLNEAEMEVLKGIVQAKTKGAIITQVFNGNFFDQDIWKLVRAIEKTGLVWVERKEGSTSVKQFHFSPDLEYFLFSSPDTISDHVSLSETINFSGKVDLENFEFTLDFEVPSDVLLRKGRIYSSKLKKMPNGNIRFDIKPYSID